MKRLLSSVFVLFLLLTAACSGQGGSAPQTAAPGAPAQGGFASISPADAMKLIQSRGDLVIVDVRSPEELREGSIKGSVLIPFFQVMKGGHNLPKDKPLLLVCAVGGRSYAAGRMLASQGYPTVYNLSGGMANWKQAGLPVEYK